MEKPEISIIIRTYNEEKYLPECLKMVFKQKIEKPFEVIITDSESSDSTISIAQKFPVHIVSMIKKDFTYGRSLNLGCQRAQGELLVFLSAHAIPFDENWLENLLTPLDGKNTKDSSNDKIAGAFSKQIPMRDANPLVRRFVEESWNDSRNPGFSNVSSAIKKEFWDIEHFDEHLIFSEDIQWSERMRRHGYVIHYVQSSIVYHSHNDNPIKFFKRNYAELYERKDENKLITYFNDSLHNLIDDLRYIFKNMIGWYWILYSFVLFSVKILICFKLFIFQNLLERK